MAGFGLANIDVGNIFSGLGQLLKDIRTTLGKPDPDKLAQLEHQVNEAEAAMMSAQAQINLVEAQSKSIFVSGWRPSVGWVASFGLAFQFIIYPIASWLLPIIGHPEIKLPAIDVSTLYPLLFALLGVGTLRTYEKTQGVQDKH